MDWETLVKPLVLACVFSALGIALFSLAFWIIVKISPVSIVKEIEQDQNVSLAIIIGSIMLGIAVIVAAAIH